MDEALQLGLDGNALTFATRLDKERLRRYGCCLALGGRVFDGMFINEQGGFVSLSAVRESRASSSLPVRLP